jgi:chemotaxis protein MotB
MKSGTTNITSNYKSILYFSLLLLFCLTSCVAKKKYLSSEISRINLKELLEKESSKTEILSDSVSLLNEELQFKNQKLALVENFSDSIFNENKKLKQQLNSINDSLYAINSKFNSLFVSYEKLKNQSSEDLQNLISQIEEKNAILLIREDSLKTLHEQNNLALLERENKIKDFQKKLNERDSILKFTRKKIEDALLGFKDAGLDVTIKHGKVYVTMSNKLLFKSGSTKIDDLGKKALLGLSLVVNKDLDLYIEIEGHTDTVPVSNLGQIQDNWDLSVLRSTEVVRYLIREGKIEPKRITASGKGQFDPVASNATLENRSKNRRTEIVLSPKLNLLYSEFGN